MWHRKSQCMNETKNHLAQPVQYYKYIWHVCVCVCVQLLMIPSFPLGRWKRDAINHINSKGAPTWATTARFNSVAKLVGYCFKSEFHLAERNYIEFAFALTALATNGCPFSAQSVAYHSSLYHFNQCQNTNGRKFKWIKFHVKCVNINSAPSVWTVERRERPI